MMNKQSVKVMVMMSVLSELHDISTAIRELYKDNGKDVGAADEIIQYIESELNRSERKFYGLQEGHHSHY